MPAVRVLVSSRERTVSDFLKSHLPSLQFEIHMANPGIGCLDRAMRVHPDIVVIDMDREEVGSDIEIIAVKHACPDARIVALGPEPPMADGAVVEREACCYLLGQWREKLVQVVEAAAQSVRQLAHGCSSRKVDGGEDE